MSLSRAPSHIFQGQSSEIVDHGSQRLLIAAAEVAVVQPETCDAAAGNQANLVGGEVQGGGKRNRPSSHVSKLQLLQTGESVKMEQPGQPLVQPCRLLTGEPQVEIFPKVRICCSLSPILADEDCTSQVAMWQLGEDEVPHFPGKTWHLQLFHP